MHNPCGKFLEKSLESAQSCLNIDAHAGKDGGDFLAGCPNILLFVHNLAVGEGAVFLAALVYRSVQIVAQEVKADVDNLELVETQGLAVLLELLAHRTDIAQILLSVFLAYLLKVFAFQKTVDVLLKQIEAFLDAVEVRLVQSIGGDILFYITFQ